FDTSGLESVYSGEISWLVPLPVTIARNGNGTVVSQVAAGSFARTYTLSAIPGAGMIFAGWTGSLPSAAATLSFVWRSNVVVQANFVPNPYPAAQGAYNGLFAEPAGAQSASSGAFSVAVSARGSYS